LAYQWIGLLVFGHGSTLGRSTVLRDASTGVLWTARVLVDNRRQWWWMTIESRPGPVCAATAAPISLT
jgi:hypothetical protein